MQQRPGAISSLTSFKFRFSYSSNAALVLVSACCFPLGKVNRTALSETPKSSKEGSEEEGTRIKEQQSQQELNNTLFQFRL
jgi:hypothetical protein